jgi:hypothetical protein
VFVPKIFHFPIGAETAASSIDPRRIHIIADQIK